MSLRLFAVAKNEESNELLNIVTEKHRKHIKKETVVCGDCLLDNLMFSVELPHVVIENRERMTDVTNIKGLRCVSCKVSLIS